MTNIDQVAQTVKRLRTKFADHDARMGDVAAIRRGDVARLAPGVFPQSWPKPIIANFIDVVARDLAEVVAPLPTFNCETGVMTSDAAKKFAARKTKIAHWYVQHSNLAVQMFRGADWYLTYGVLPMVIEPDFEANTPRIRLDDPVGAYWETDFYGNVRQYAKVWRDTAGSLALKFPDHAAQILGGTKDQFGNYNRDRQLEVVRFYDADGQTLYLPEAGNLVLAQVANPMPGRVPVVVVVRPSFDDETRGQFDDVLWVQVAKAKMAVLGLEAAEKSVRAPLAVPNDVQRVAYGPDATIRTAQPEKIRKVGLELPPGAFQTQQLLEQEAQRGARYPDARMGGAAASVITGRGIQELMGGFDTQVKTAQQMFEWGFERAVRLCFETDEKLFADVRKEIRGVAMGAAFSENYTPARDIRGDYTVTVTYGFAAGMDPNRALVFMLQLRADKLIDRNTLQRQLPFDVDLSQIQERIDNEELDDALKQGVFSMLQSMGVLAANGMDPTQILVKAATLGDAREKGVPLRKAVLEAFQPQTPPPGQAAPGDTAASPGGPGEGAPGGGTPEGLQENGLPFGVAPGQAGMGAGGRPPLEMLMAGIDGNGSAKLSAATSRRQPIGT